MKNASDVVKVGDTVKVKVLTVDAEKKRLALSMKGMGARGGGGRYNAGQGELRLARVRGARRCL